MIERQRYDRAPTVFSLCRALHNEKDGDSDLACFVDHVIRDARAGEGDEALRQEVQQYVVAPECAALPSRPQSSLQTTW